MKKFLIISISFLLFAVLCSVGVFWYLSLQPSLVKEKTAAHTLNTGQAINDNVLLESEFSQDQKNRLEEYGIDGDSYTITPEMIKCAKEKIGIERAQEIADGSEPTILETGKLLLCL